MTPPSPPLTLAQTLRGHDYCVVSALAVSEDEGGCPAVISVDVSGRLSLWRSSSMDKVGFECVCSLNVQRTVHGACLFSGNRLLLLSLGSILSVPLESLLFRHRQSSINGQHDDADIITPELLSNDFCPLAINRLLAYCASGQTANALISLLRDGMALKIGDHVLDNLAGSGLIIDFSLCHHQALSLVVLRECGTVTILDVASLQIRAVFEGAIDGAQHGPVSATCCILDEQRCTVLVGTASGHVYSISHAIADSCARPRVESLLTYERPVHRVHYVSPQGMLSVSVGSECHIFGIKVLGDDTVGLEKINTLTNSPANCFLETGAKDQDDDHASLLLVLGCTNGLLRILSPPNFDHAPA